MPRKGKLEPAQPSSSRSPAAASKYDRWRRSVQELLTLHWQPASLDVEGVAATVVGMFDAGATDAEVAAFLRAQELLDREELWLTDESRMALVQELHRSAGSNISMPSDEEL